MNDTNDSRSEVAQALAEGRLFDGVLTRAPRKKRSCPISFLSSNIAADFFDVLQATKAATMTFDVLPGHQGHLSWIATCYADRHQHRFVLPLAGQSVKAMLLQLRENPLGFVLHPPLPEPAFERHTGLPADVTAELAASVAQIADRVALFKNHFLAVAEALAPEFTYSPGSESRPLKIYVSSILPPELQMGSFVKGFNVSELHARTMLHFTFEGYK